jgi:hypothetical protein
LNAIINIIISVEFVRNNPTPISYGMNAIYVSTSLATFLAVYLNFYQNIKIFVYPAIFVQQMRHFVVIFDFEQAKFVNGDLELMIRITF